jgi:predicted MPP superfamily phosphohydrolase
MRWVDPDWFEVHTETLPRAKFPAPVGFKILHLSDLHYGPQVSLAMVAEAIRLGLAEKPDLICLTGDHVSGLLRDAETLRPLSEAAPTFACTGNHDGLPGLNPSREETHHGRVATMLKSAGIRYLHNETATVAVRGTTLTVAGPADFGPVKTTRRRVSAGAVNRRRCRPPSCLLIRK